MNKVKQAEDIYHAIDELIKSLAENGKQTISNTLDHRMYKVSWTSRSELFEELSLVLENIVNDESVDLDPLIVGQIIKIKQLIDESIQD